MRYPFATIALLLASSAARASVYTNAWDVDLQRNPPAVIDLWRGETVALFARTGITNLPASAEFLWQSPGMGAAWYTTNAVATASGDVTAVWTPEMDGGAASYAFFFRVGNGDLYRPRGTLKMQGSPGTVPNEIAIPPRVLDFATVTVLNAPWTTLNDVDAAISDALEGYEPGGGGVIEEADPLALPVAESALALATNALPKSRPTATDYLHVSGTAPYLGLYPSGTGAPGLFLWPSFLQLGPAGNTRSYNWPVFAASGDTFAVQGDIASHNSSGTAHAARFAAAAAAIEGDVLAAVFSLTNALLVVSNGVASVETNGVPVWSSGSGSVPPSVTNELWQSIAALQGTVESLQGAVAALSHDWGAYAPDGSPNPDPEYMLWINRPATVWGAGFQWAVSGGHAVLTATGAVAFASGGNGEMRIGPGDGTNYFGFVQGGSVEVGASASGITVADDVATIVYPYESGDFPTLWFTPDLATPFEIMTGVAWVDNADGTATVTAPATTPKGFWRATTSASYAAEFRSTMPARFSGGVWGATNAVPVLYDSTITVESGGKSYRIPAEEL
ncbi:MAG: hypothetical protein GX615_06750 [Lentisphaerae bacterium]|nr:hypothetical protein [Lentisphaerota bacterium]